MAEELGLKDQFSSPYHPQSNGILEKFHSFLKTCIRKHINGKVDWEDTGQHLLLSFRILPGIHSRKSPHFILFGRDPLTLLRKLLLPKIWYQGDLEALRFDLTLTRKNICLSRQVSGKGNSITRFQDKFKVSDFVYVKDMLLLLGNLSEKVDFK